ncbi:hypothetical protein Tco_1341288 [Tanacetum coccineum]
MRYFRSLHSQLQVLSKEDLKGTCIEHRFKREFMSLFGQDDDTFTSTIQMSNKYFAKYSGIEVKQFRETLLQHMSNVKKSVAKRTQSSMTKSEVQDESSRSGNDTDTDDADIRPIYDEEPMAEVQLTAECNIFATGQQHTEQPEIINEGRVDQSKTIEQTTSLLANNAELKARIQEKVFAIAALKMT